MRELALSEWHGLNPENVPQLELWHLARAYVRRQRFLAVAGLAAQREALNAPRQPQHKKMSTAAFINEVAEVIT